MCQESFCSQVPLCIERGSPIDQNRRQDRIRSHMPSECIASQHTDKAEPPRYPLSNHHGSVPVGIGDHLETTSRVKKGGDNRTNGRAPDRVCVTAGHTHEATKAEPRGGDVCPAELTRTPELKIVMREKGGRFGMSPPTNRVRPIKPCQQTC